VANLPVAGNITGLYREDYGCNATANAFVVYSDVWRERQGRQSSLASNTDDAYVIRICDRKKDVN
jgi:hypothetical protein